MSGAAFPLIKVSKASTSDSNLLTNLLDASPCESHLVGAASRGFQVFVQSQTRKPLQWHISLVSKEEGEVVIASTSNKVLYFGNNEQILPQVNDSYN